MKTGIYEGRLRRKLKNVGMTIDRIERTRNNHLKVILPNGRKVFTSLTPSCNRAFKNLIRDIKSNNKEQK
jgi:hypothetical protein